MKQTLCLLFFLCLGGVSFSASVCFYYNPNTIYQHGLTPAVTYMNVYAAGTRNLIAWTQLAASDVVAGCMPASYDQQNYPVVDVEMGLRVYGNPEEFYGVKSGTRFSVDEEGGATCTTTQDGVPVCYYQSPVFTQHQQA
ncbi:MAG: hypothetical protein COV52_04010 [Gammaproteobacteria bacterium CG11_big_fil_rev_8_21_14_0_20_46_22]|nr:MAG: hypothetical protein COW05_04205 [Gammaproteobacteria bacterium CG12_big_fil_rev_8_21_14_0_65_46_12]PIR11362.1 MAG: hypothetical protein COV52_04010 [Gammaproteobacteria bacterium CG11_big_fil_rev_8_21_14_0_20_46_22]